jgi:FixJ family two-component response regulator
MHGATGGAPMGKRNGNYRHGGRTKEAIQAVTLVNWLSRLRTASPSNFIRDKSKKAVANVLGSTGRTIKAHHHRVMEEMQVRSLLELVSLLNLVPS